MSTSSQLDRSEGATAHTPESQLVPLQDSVEPPAGVSAGRDGSAQDLQRERKAGAERSQRDGDHGTSWSAPEAPRSFALRTIPATAAEAAAPDGSYSRNASSSSDSDLSNHDPVAKDPAVNTGSIPSERVITAPIVRSDNIDRPLPPPPPTDSPPVSPEALRRIGHALKQAAVDGEVSTIDIELSPRELGHLRLEIRLDGNKLRLIGHVSEAHAARAMELGSQELRQTLAQAGIELNDFSISWDGGGSRRNPDAFRSQGAELPSYGRPPARVAGSARGTAVRKSSTNGVDIIA